MYKLMILDDEPIAIDGLINYVDWEKNNIKVVSTASDGNEGLIKIADDVPDIIITDVKMPNMDGIEFANIIAAKYPDIKIVFISGYDDVEYLRTALHLNASDYILKPINLKNLTETIVRITKELDLEKLKKLKETENEITIFHSQQILVKEYLTKLVQNEIVKSEVAKNLQLLNLKLTCKGIFCAIIVLIDDYKKVFEPLPLNEQISYKYSIINIFNEVLNEKFTAYLIEDYPDKFIGIIQMQEESYDLLTAEIQKAKEHIVRIFNISLSVSVGKTCYELIKIHESQESASETLLRRFLLGKGCTIVTTTFKKPENNTYHISISTQSLIETTLKSGDKSKIANIINNVFTNFKKNYAPTPSTVMHFAFKLISIATQVTISSNFYTSEINCEEEKMINLLESAETINEIQDYISAYFINICDYFSIKTDDKAGNLIKEVKSIIQKRYFEDITINDIASEVFLTPNYLCALFKQSTETTINQYLNHVRIEVAKKLMQDRENKFYDIGYLVGYSDASYFTKQFKKYTGCTPKQYRNMTVSTVDDDLSDE